MTRWPGGTHHATFRHVTLRNIFSRHFVFQATHSPFVITQDAADMLTLFCEANQDASRQASEHKTIYVRLTFRKELPRTFIRAKTTRRQQFANCFHIYRPTVLLRCVCVKFTR